MSCRKNCCKTLSFLFVLFALGVVAVPAFGQSCLQDEYNKVASQTLNCSANDVRVAKVINIRDLAGAPLTSCSPGTFSFVADFLVQTTSKSSRSNIGLYFATGDVTKQPTALTGVCSDNIIAPQHTCGTTTCGSNHYEELDPQPPTKGAVPDNCGDSSSTDQTVCLNSSNQVVSCPAPAGGSTWTGTQIITAQIDNFNCTAPAGTNQLVLPNCTSWQVPGSTIQCLAASPNYIYPFDASTPPKPEAIPGSPSKCNCATIPLGITVQSPNITVTKNCSVNGVSGTLPISPDKTPPACSITPEGGLVTYTVEVTNSSNFGDIVVDQICDDQYGSIFTATGYTPACPTGAIGTRGLLSTSNNTCASGLTVAKGTPQNCSFQATQAENVVVTDTVTVRGHGATNGTFGPTDSNPVVVTSHEAPTTGTITKSYVTTTDACATVRYGVVVNNTSAALTDETLTLSGLTDDAVDITSTATSVLGTTCGVVNGVGTLTGTTGAGTLPKTLSVNGGTYSCQFDRQFCSAVGTITSAKGVCDIAGTKLCTAGKTGATCSSNSECDLTCKGIQHTDIVSASLTGDEGASDVVVLDPGTVTVSECLTVSSQ
jgi:hypothetical protein